MVSRKKSKGKDRKAKKLEAERARVRNIWWLYIAWEKKMEMTVTYNHDNVIQNNLDHPVSRFMDDFMTLDKLSLNNLKYACESNNGKIVLNNESYKEMATQIMIRIGINMLLMDEKTETLRALIMAKSVVVLEHFDTGMENSVDAATYSREVATKIRDIHLRSSSGRRDCLKFFSKRVSCSYLKKKHQEARRSQQKMGLCYECVKEKERVALSMCSRCMIAQYCSRDCQVANWPEHREECGLFVKKQTANTSRRRG